MKKNKKKKIIMKDLKSPKIKVCKEVEKSKEFDGFPLDHYSYSSFQKFSTNPFMFKVNNINGDYLDVTSKPASVLGSACHKALEKYYSDTKKDNGERIKEAHEAGTEYLKSYSDNLIEYNDKIQNRQKLDEKFAFSFFGYLKDVSLDVKEILLVEKMLKYKIQIGDKVLPIPLKGAADLVYRDKEDRIIIRDHKFTSQYSPTEEIDGAKLLQAAFNYFLVYAELGEEPYSMIYEEFKVVENRDHSRQTKEFEIVYADHPLIFEFFYRFYDDVTNALLGKQVFVPNLSAFYDKEVSILAYIHRLDIDEERDKQFKKLKVENITDFLKKKIQKDGAMKKYLEVVSTKFISGTTLNYKNMEIEDKIKMKLAEHGLSLDFHSKISGGAVTLYRYEPSIGLKMSRIESFVKDIEQVVAISGIRILAPIPNSDLVGFEVPNVERTFPVASPEFDGFNLAIGADIMGETYRLDIRETPHMLVAGATGSGKSVFISSLITQLQQFDRKDAMITLLDPKMVELSIFKNGKNTESYHSQFNDIAGKLQKLVEEMDRRYGVLQSFGCKNLEAYNNGEAKIPYLFVFIDEYGDLVSREDEQIKNSNNKNRTVKKNILLLAQKARAAGIHVILTTQRPSIKIIDGDIKANFPTRVAFRTSTSTDSMVTLDQAGAEKLLGKGDMLLLNPAKSGLERLQGFNVKQ